MTKPGDFLDQPPGESSRESLTYFKFLKLYFDERTGAGTTTKRMHTVYYSLKVKDGHLGSIVVLNKDLPADRVECNLIRVCLRIGEPVISKRPRDVARATLIAWRARKSNNGNGPRLEAER